MADRLQELLGDAGFDPRRPTPALAWSAFRRFAAEPAEVLTTELWFESSDGDPLTDALATFGFVRMFTHYPDDGSAWSEQITAQFTAPPSVRIGLNGASVQAENLVDLQAWFEAVEESPSFRAGLAFRGWTFELRIDGS